MSTADAEPGSFRDPSGRVFLREGRVFRTVMAPAVADFEFVRSTGLLDRLADEGLAVAARQVEAEALGEDAAGARYVLEHPKLPFVSYPYEWCFPALKAAALLHLDVHLKALEHGVTLADATAYNVQFVGGRPTFIDTLSFRRYRDGELWIGHRQFCEQFLNPLLLRALLGITHNAWYRGCLEGITAAEVGRLLPFHRKLSWNVFSQVVLQATFQSTADRDGTDRQTKTLKEGRLPLIAFRRMLEGLRKWIGRLEPKGTGKTVWADYARAHSYSSDEREAKLAFVRDFASATKPGLLWDLGCNTGDFAKAALEGGAGYAVGFDFDQGALEAAFDRSRAESLDFLPLFLDAANPPPDQGWAETERQGLGTRARADGLIALAFVHHLAIARNIPLDRLVDWLLGLAPAGIIEFVPKEDPMVQRLLRLREDIFPDYTEETFAGLLGARAQIVRSEAVSAQGRRLFWYARS